MIGEYKEDGARTFYPMRYTGLPNDGDSVTWRQAFVMDTANTKNSHCPEKEIAIWISWLVWNISVCADMYACSV